MSGAARGAGHRAHGTARGSGATTTPRAQRARAVCAALLPLALAGCTDLFVEPAPPAGVPVAVSLVTPASAAGGAAEAYAQADRARVQVYRSDADLGIVLDTTVAFVPSAAETRIRAEVDVEEDGTPHLVSVTLLRGAAPLFEGSATVAVSRGATAEVEIQLDPVAAQLLVRQQYPTLTAYGETLQLEGLALFATGDTVPDPLVWLSLDPAIVEVSPAGLATARGDGVAHVRASGGGRTAEVQVTVRARIATVEVLPNTLVMRQDSVHQLQLVLRDANGNAITSTRVATWTSSSFNVATVSPSGVVEARAPGKATITAASEGVQGQTDVTVLPPAIARIDVTPSPATVGVGARIRLTATPYDAAGDPITGYTFEWASSNPAVASVDASGLVTGDTLGTVEISATADGVTGRATVEVVPRIVITPSSLTLIGLSREFQLFAQVFGIADQRVRWRSSNPNVVEISPNGFGATRSFGVATITAESVVMPGLIGIAIVRVEPGSVPPNGSPSSHPPPAR